MRLIWSTCVVVLVVEDGASLGLEGARQGNGALFSGKAGRELFPATDTSHRLGLQLDDVALRAYG